VITDFLAVWVPSTSLHNGGVDGSYWFFVAFAPFALLVWWACNRRRNVAIQPARRETKPISIAQDPATPSIPRYCPQCRFALQRIWFLYRE